MPMHSDDVITIVSLFFRVVFFPPIPTLSCEMSSVQLTLAHDDVADEAYMSLPILLTPRINYVEGGCLNVSDRIQVLYQVCKLSNSY